MAETTTAVKFGTDGWRGIIADDFTYANVRVAARAIAHYVLKHEDATRGVCIGYDTRFGRGRSRALAAEVLASAGIPVALDRRLRRLLRSALRCASARRQAA